MRQGRKWLPTIGWQVVMQRAAAQRAKFAKKVHKPPLWVNVMNFELNVFNASIWVPWSPSDPKKL
jgi:hypothetical protein